MKTKNILSLLVVIVLSAGYARAQDAIDKYFKSYADNPDFTSIVVSSKMFELFSKFDSDDPNSAQLREAIKGLNGIRILAYDGNPETTPKIATDYRTAINKIGKEYETLMSVDDKEEKIRFFIRENGDKISELLMIVGSKDKLFLMSLTGDIDLDKIARLSKSMNINGMNYLKNLDDQDKTK